MTSWHDCVDGSTIYKDRDCKKNVRFRGRTARVPYLPGEPQDEAGLPRKFET